MLETLDCTLRDCRYYNKCQFLNKSISVDILKDIKKVKMRIR